MTPAPVGLRCPEHSGRTQGIQRVTRGVERAVTGVGSRRTNTLTLALIGINVAVAVVEFASGSHASFTDNRIFENGALFASAYSSSGHLIGVAHGQWWRLFTSMFLHANFLHLATNMYSLFFVGSILEHVIGRWRFALLYVTAGLVGSAGALVDKPLVPTVGASGAIFGLLGALLVLERRGNIATGGQIAGLIVLNLVITFVFSSFISVGAHVGGLIGGIVLMIAFLHFRRSSMLSAVSAAAVIVVALVIAYSKVRNYS
jgi:membrane associated rhomboid family serine protease